jgi:hypothetical protein
METGHGRSVPAHDRIPDRPGDRYFHLICSTESMAPSVIGRGANGVPRPTPLELELKRELSDARLIGAGD